MKRQILHERSERMTDVFRCNQLHHNHSEVLKPLNQRYCTEMSVKSNTRKTFGTVHFANHNELERKMQSG